MAPAARAPRAGEIFNRLDVEIDVVLIKNGIWRIRAGIERLAIVDGVQRVQGDEAGLESVGGPIDESHEVAKIAAAPVAGRPYPVETDRDSGGAPALAGVGTRPRAVRRHDIARRAAAGTDRNRNVVITEGQVVRQMDFLADPGAVVQVRRGLL